MDKAGDVFLDTRSGSGRFGSEFLKLPANGGAPVTISVGDYLIHSLAVDAAGDIFFTSIVLQNAKLAPYITEIPAGGSTPITLGDFGSAQAIELSVNSQGTVYVGELFYGGVVEIQMTGSANFQNVNVCPAAQSSTPPCSETAYLFYTVTAGGTLGTPTVRNTGNSTSDFSIAGGSTCTGSVAISSTCTVAVTFTPQGSGARSGIAQVVDGSGTVIATTNLIGNGVTNTPPISVTITSPGAGAILSGITPLSISTTGAVTSLQLQVDGVNQGGAVPVSGTLSVDTAVLVNGAHSLSVVASDALSDTATSLPDSITVSNSGGGYQPFITGQTLGALRNNYSGFVGFVFTTGSTPVQISSLGRYVAPGNSGSHLLKLVQAKGIDMPAG